MTLSDDLRARLHGRIVVLGIGNASRGDDAAGPVLARRIAAAGVSAVDGEDVPERHLGEVIAAAPGTIVVVDSADLGAAPGSAAVVERGGLAEVWAAPHRVPVGLLMDYLAAETGARVILVAVQPGGLEPGGPLSDEVERTVNALVEVLGECVEPSIAAPAARREGVGVQW